MRIGFLTEATTGQLDWAKQNGFGSIEWMRFETSFASRSPAQAKHIVALLHQFRPQRHPHITAANY